MNTLVEFSVANNRSINELCTLSMIASGISDEPIDNIIKLGNNKILKSAVIYGANSSGKSNIVKSLSKMRRVVLSSVKLNDNEELAYDPFLLSNEGDKPSRFEVIFILNKEKYRYGFEIDLTKVNSEWLYRTTLSGKNEVELFYRELNIIEYNEKLFTEGNGKAEMINSNRLLISLCSQLGGEVSKKIISWFQQKVNVISGISADGYANYSKLMLNYKLDGYNEAKDFFKKLQLGFNEIKCVESDEDKKIELYSLHNIYDNEGSVVNQIPLEINNIESEGTKKIIELSGPIFDTLNEGKLLVIDELDAKLHPLISHHIINLFNNPLSNPLGAQLILTTHDTHLLSSKLFRRDQIWFTEKDNKEQTDLYNMMDIALPDGSKPRNDANYEKNYIAGRYGGVPYIINE